MRGAIFMCNKQTRHECFKRRVFGLPATKLNFVKQIKKGMILFLFDTDDRRMYGVYEAISDGGMNYAPNAYEKTGSHFPAQVRFKIIWKCWYLTEAEFKPAIIANYFTSNKFNQHLSFEQVSYLLSLFEAKKKTADEGSRSPRTSSSANHSPRTSSRLSANPNPSFNPDSYQFQSSNFDSRRLSSNPNPNPDPYQYQSSNTDSMRLSSNPNPDPYQYQSSNSDSLRHRSNPNLNPVSYQQMSNFDNMHLSSNPNPSSYQYPTHASLYQYQYDPNNPGITSSSAYNTQNNQQNQIGTVSEPKCETDLNSNQDHTKPHPHCDYCAIKNKGEYNSSSQSMQFYTSNPQNYNNITIGGEGSNVGEVSQHQSHICNQVPENFYASVFERLQGIPSAQQNPNFVPESPNPNPRLYADSERPSVFSRLIVKEQKVEIKPSKNDEEPSIDQLLYSLREKSNQWSGERKGKLKSNQWINDKTMKSVIEKQPSTEIEAKEESGSDGTKMEMDVDLIKPSLENFEFNERQIPFLNFKRRSGERKVSVEPGGEGSKKKKRFVRPSLEIEGPIRKIDTCFDEVMKEAETKETNVEKKDSKEAETEGKNEEKIDSKEAEIELEFGAPNMHEFEAKAEEKMDRVPEFMEIGSENQKYDLQGPSCKNGISKDIEMECELGPTIAEPQEEGEIIFSPLLQINEEKDTELMENVGPTQNDNLSCNEGKHDNIEKYTAFNQESDIEKNRTEKKNDGVNLSVIELETKIEVGEIELGKENDVENHNEKLNLVEKEAQNFMQINPINNCGGVLELGDKNEQKNDNTNLNVTKLAPKSLMEISPVKFYGEVARLDEKYQEKKEFVTEPESAILKNETGLKSRISNQEAGPKSGIPNQDAEPKLGIANPEAEPKSEIPKDEAELKSGIPNQETELKSGIQDQETVLKSGILKEAELKSGIPNPETELKSETPKDKTEPESEILKEESEPKSGNSKPSLGFDIRSIIRKAKAEKQNEAGGPCKDKDEFINGDFIALD